MVYQGENNFFFHLTSAENELAILEGKTNNTNKFSVIDLGKCGSLLKENYNINENSSLIIMKYEKVSNVSSERLLQYEVYEPINKTKLNLSICDNENINIDIYIPVILSEKTQNLYNELQNLGYDLFDITVIVHFIMMFALHINLQMVLMFYYLIELIHIIIMMIPLVNRIVNFQII